MQFWRKVIVCLYAFLSFIDIPKDPHDTVNFLIPRFRNTQKFSNGNPILWTFSQEYSPNKFVRTYSKGYSRDSFRSTGSKAKADMNDIPYAVAVKCRQLITGNRIVIFSKTTCPYCTRVKKLFTTLKEEPLIYEIDVEPDGMMIQEYLFQTTKQRTVPNVFVHSRHVGGCDDTFKAYGDGSLQTVLAEAFTVSLEDKVDAMLEQYPVVIFSKTTCPYCYKVKALFRSLGTAFKVYELDEEEDGVLMQEYLHKRTKQKTVPNVFVNKRHIGGCNDTMKSFGNGSLQVLLTQASSALDPDEKLRQILQMNNVVVFTDSSEDECKKVLDIFASYGFKPLVFIVSQENDGNAVRERLLKKTMSSDMPKVFIKGMSMGTTSDIEKLKENGQLSRLLEEDESNEIDKVVYDYDIIVIGGGSGGLAAAKEAANLGKKVALCDFVVPSPMGTTWGLGGTCVNVGCIPKKLMHQAAIHAENFHDSQSFGWSAQDSTQHSWELMVENVQNYIKSLNFGYRKELNKRKVKYYNAFAEFVNTNKVKITMKNGKVEEISAKDFIIAVGGRPSYPDFPGAREHCITSDDLFSLTKNPGKTLIIGASYIALECGGFLHGLKYDVTIMVRSILLRGFDRQMADLIGEHMEKIGIKFLKEYVPKEVKKDELGKLKIIAVKKSGEEEVLTGYDTVILATGREACTEKLGLNNLPNLTINPKNKKIIVDTYEKSSISNIYAIGDVIDGKPELTPVAIHAGKYLGQRLAGVHRITTNYKQVPTTVFTPLEYGCVGMSEEEATEVFGEQNVIVYHNAFKPLEHALSREDTLGYAKLVCVKSLDELVVGFHVLSPNAGEITQGFAIGLKLNAKKRDFDDLIGIHPTCAEIFTTMTTVKNPGDRPPETTGC